jgi:hypothetical protein
MYEVRDKESHENTEGPVKRNKMKSMRRLIIPIEYPLYNFHRRPKLRFQVPDLKFPTWKFSIWMWTSYEDAREAC